MSHHSWWLKLDGSDPQLFKKQQQNHNVSKQIKEVKEQHKQRYNRRIGEMNSQLGVVSLSVRKQMS